MRPERYDGRHSDAYGYFTVRYALSAWWFEWHANRRRPMDAESVGAYGPFDDAREAYEAAIEWRTKPREVFMHWAHDRQVVHVTPRRGGT